MRTDQIVAMIVAERERQNAKWGPQDHIYPMWVSILIEEVGEVAAEVNKLHGETTLLGAKRRQRQLVTELVQCAAVIFQMLENEKAA